MPTPIASLGWWRNRGTAATPSYSVHILPWAGVKASSGTWARAQASGELGGGNFNEDAAAQNNYIEYDIWLDAGTYKWALVYGRQTNRGICSLMIDGVSSATIDMYGTAQTNTYAEVTGIAVTAGLKTVQFKAATKNASSSAYAQFLQSIALIRTGS